MGKCLPQSAAETLGWALAGRNRNRKVDIVSFQNIVRLLLARRRPLRSASWIDALNASNSGREEYSTFHAVSFAEMLPQPENRVTLDPGHRDAWGIPVLRIDCAHSNKELTRAHEQIAMLRELAELAGVTLDQIDATAQPPGIAVHESGTARMGRSSESSVLDRHNQCWEAQGLYVTDGACFPSQGSQNPTLTILALTARACDHAVRTARGNEI